MSGKCSHSLCLLLVIQLISHSLAVLCNNTVGNWVLGDDFYFQFVNSIVTWDAARTYCRQLWNGTSGTNPVDLAILNTSRNLLACSASGDRWIGCSQDSGSIEPDFGWKHVDGTAVDFTKTLWITAEPNNAGGTEGCCLLKDTTGRLNDGTCGNTFAFVCGIPGMNSTLFDLYN
jgi:hypothetical protein